MATINGTTGNDVLEDTPDQDVIAGFEGDDIITVTGPADRVDGGSGVDTLIVQWSNSTGRVVSTLRAVDSEFYDVPNRNVVFNNIEKFRLYTGSGNDELTTGDFEDLVSSGAGNDVIDTAKGVATVDGGAGVDSWRANFTDNAAAFTLNLRLTGLQTVGNLNGSSVSNIENVFLQLGAGADVITTGYGALQDTISGGGGDDVALFAGGNNDSFAGEAGTDLLIADFSAAITKVEHRREVDGDPNPRVFSADNLFQVRYTSVERFEIRGGSADDVITTGDLSDAISGGAGDDFMNSLAGQAIIDGGAGQDVWFGDMRYSNVGITLDLNLSGVQQLGNGSSVADVEKVDLILGDGNDTVVTRYGANNLLVDKFDKPGDATTGLRDVIDAGGGDDVITTGGGGAYGDSINGGAGVDTLILRFEDYTQELFVVEGLTPGSGQFGRGPNTFSGIERMQIYSGSGNDTLQTIRGDWVDFVSGGAGNDFIAGFGGADTLKGDDGDDTIQGGAGADLIDGGAGVDRVSYDFEGGSGGVVVDLNGGLSTDTFGDRDTLIGIENVIATQQADTIYGSAAANEVEAQGGADIVYGGGGADILRGGMGDDVLIGNADPFLAETDQLIGGDGNDLIYGENADVISGGFGFDSLIAVNAYDFALAMGATSIEYAVLDFGNDTINAAGLNVGASVFASGGNDNITGSGFQDLLFGGAGNDVVLGGDGQDAIVGNEGVDVLSGGDGDDRVYFDAQDSFVSGGAGSDAGYILPGTGGGVTINMAAASLEFIQDFAGGNDTILGSTMTQRLNAYAGGGNDFIDGSNFDDVLWGEAGDDTINGGLGIDVLVGGAGADVLAGGEGLDVLYGNAGGGSDGARDVFKFSFIGDANYDAVFDFVSGEDKLDLTAFGTSFAAITINNDGGSAEVFLNGQRLALVVGAYATLTASDFIFTAGAGESPDAALQVVETDAGQDSDLGAPADWPGTIGAIGDLWLGRQAMTWDGGFATAWTSQDSSWSL